MKHPAKLLILLCASFLVRPTFITSVSGADCVVECMQRSGCWSGGSVSDPARCNGMPNLCNIQCRGQQKSNHWGAIAYSVKDKEFGYSYGWEDVDKAKKAAMDSCVKTGTACKPWIWYNNQCGAIAADGEKIGWGVDDSKQTADKGAITACTNIGGKKCVVQVSQCSR
jgi:hypothetical protein